MISTYICKRIAEEIERIVLLSHLEETVFHCLGFCIRTNYFKPVLSNEFFSDCYIFNTK